MDEAFHSCLRLLHPFGGGFHASGSNSLSFSPRHIESFGVRTCPLARLVLLAFLCYACRRIVRGWWLIDLYTGLARGLGANRPGGEPLELLRASCHGRCTVDSSSYDCSFATSYHIPLARDEVVGPHHAALTGGVNNGYYIQAGYRCIGRHMRSDDEE